MSIKGTFIFVLISSILAILFINSLNYIYLGLFAFLILITIKKINIKYSLMLMIVFAFFCFYRPNKEIKTSETYQTLNVKVIEEHEKYMIVNNNNINYLIYIDDKYYKGDELEVKGDVIEIENDLDLYLFEFKDYLNNKRVYYQIDNPEIILLSSHIRWNESLIELFTSKLENESETMVKMLLFNDKNADLDVYGNLININALHLFVVSGFHISFLFTLFSFIFKPFKKVGVYLSLSICLFYVALLGFTISASRALICLIINRFLKKYLNECDAISIAGILFLLIEPLNIYSYSFILTYVVAFAICFVRPLIKKCNKILGAFIVSLTCLFVLLPIQLCMNYQINFISCFTNILLNYVVMVIFVFGILSMLLSFINGDIFSFIYRLFFNLIDKLSDISKPVVFGSMKGWMIAIYYVIIIAIIIALENKNIKKIAIRIASLLIFLILLYFRVSFIPYQQITFLNVYQGDCTIIVDKYGGGVMLVDTGGLLNYDLAEKKIVPYLHYQGIRKIDKVVITHDDMDHCYALNSLVNLMPIDEIIRDNSIEYVELGSIHLDNLNVNANYAAKNDNSIVLYGKIANHNIAIMGDAPSMIEKKIIEEYPDIEIDVLRIGHHGSSTSSCEEFISYYKPDIAIISVGANNRYGHPTEEVINRLLYYECKIYRTDKNGTIKMQLDFIISAK